MGLNSLPRNPAPQVTGESEPVWEVVIADLPYYIRGRTRSFLVDIMRNRDAAGEEKYGTRLNTYNGRDSVVDALEEVLDAVVYLKQAELEGHISGQLFLVAVDLLDDLSSVYLERGNNNGQ